MAPSQGRAGTLTTLGEQIHEEDQRIETSLLSIKKFHNLRLAVLLGSLVLVLKRWYAFCPDKVASWAINYGIKSKPSHFKR